MEQRSCSLCGTTVEVEDGGIPAGWSFSVEKGRVTHQCPDCVRRNVRAIEGKLPEEWWD